MTKVFCVLTTALCVWIVCLLFFLYYVRFWEILPNLIKDFHFNFEFTERSIMAVIQRCVDLSVSNSKSCERYWYIGYLGTKPLTMPLTICNLSWWTLWRINVLITAIECRADFTSESPVTTPNSSSHETTEMTSEPTSPKTTEPAHTTVHQTTTPAEQNTTSHMTSETTEPMTTNPGTTETTNTKTTHHVTSQITTETSPAIRTFLYSVNWLIQMMCSYNAFFSILPEILLFHSLNFCNNPLVLLMWLFCTLFRSS